MSDKSTKKKDDKKLAKDTGKKDAKKSGAKASSAKKTNPFKAFGKFLREYRSELKKISWPTPKDTTKNALITLAAILIVGIFIWILDYGLSSLRDVALKKIPEWSVSSQVEDNADTPITSDSSLIVSTGDSGSSAAE